MTKNIADGVTPHSEMSEALAVVNEAIDKAVASGRWMVAVWSTDGKRVILETRTTWDWPNAGYKHALSELQQVIAKERPAPDPLPVAAEFLSLVSEDQADKAASLENLAMRSQEEQCDE